MEFAHKLLLLRGSKAEEEVGAAEEEVVVH